MPTARCASILLLAIALVGCPNDDNGTGTTEEPTSETSAATTSMSTSGGESSSTRDSLDPSNCDGCLAGFQILVYDSDMNSIVDQIEISYTVDGVDSGKTKADLCNESACGVYDSVGDLVIEVTYGTCTQSETSKGWESCGCSASYAPWDPLTFTFDPSCLDDA